MASYHGTLAAVRCLGSHGVTVTVADASVLAKAAWSKYATRAERCPDVEKPARFVPWLLQYGERNPGHVLYPTSDDVAFLYALYEAELRKHYLLWQPPMTVIYGLLNKRILADSCARVGVATPRSWFPQDEDELLRMGETLSYPILIKPQTQVLYWPHAKGLVAESRSMLRPMYEKFRRDAGYARELLAFDPGASRPVLQAYFASAVDSIYSVSGFVDETAELWVARSSRKVLQRPRQLGVGLAFEEAPLDPDVAERLRSLCKSVGYYGVFEAEFIVDDGRHMLIDFNPRFYGQMGFEIARDLPLPMMVYAAATGDRERLRELVEAARNVPEQQGRVFCNRLELRALLRQQRLGGHLTKADVEHWERWLTDHAGKLSDAVLDPEDPRPAYAHVAQEIYGYVRHPRSFIRQVRSNARQ
jgi:predicted ATP-grasp superfamily ATP-dependent carboligase